MSFTIAGTVSSEGGPLVLADARVLRGWRGAHESSDYERACQLSEPGGALPVGTGSAIVWELGGPGTADVIQAPGHLVLCRTWLPASEWPAAGKHALRVATAPVGVPQAPLGTVLVESGTLAILWSPESGESIRLLGEPYDPRRDGFMSVEGAYLRVALEPGAYACVHDQGTVDGFNFRRCRVSRAT